MAAGRSRRLWIVNGVIVLVLLLAAGGTIYGLTKTSSSTDTGLRTTPVGRGTVAETVTAAGSVTTANSATLNFGSSGKIAEIRVRLGDRVTKGQTVARLDNEYADANLKAANAQVSADEQALDDAEYQKDHPQSSQSSTGTQSQTQTGAGTQMQTGGVAPTPGSPPANPAANPAAKPPATQPPPPPPPPSATQPPPPAPPRHHGLFGDWFSTPGHGVEAVGPAPVEGGTTPAPSPGATGSTTGTGTAGTGTGSTSGAGGSTGASGTTAQTSEDPGEAAVRNARAKLDQDKAARIQAEQATENLDLVAPEDGTVVSLDGIVGQIAGPQGIVLSSTATGNPAGGRLPDGSAISSGAGSGQSATTGSSGSSGSSGASSGAAGGASASSGAGGTSGVTAAPSAPAVMTIANLGAMQVLAQVPELDVGKVANGQPVAVSVNALQGQKIPGSVTSINLLPGSQSTIQYGTAILMAAPPPGLRPGMSASVSITTRQANDVTFLPSVAVTPVGGPDSGQATVQVLQPDGTTAPRTIGTGLASDTVTQVTSGLSVGDLVVLPTSAPAPLPGGGGGGGGGNGGGGSSGGGGGSGGSGGGSGR